MPDLLESSGQPGTPRLRGRSWVGGPRRALLLHGSTSSSATWWRVGPGLAAQGWAVSALDLPSHGEAAVAGTRAAQPRAASEDCAHAVADLARCRSDDVAAGLRLGATWSAPGTCSAEVMLLLAPDAPGTNRLDDATALRGLDRRDVVSRLGAQVTLLRTGHCVHRDDPDGWLSAVTDFASR